MLNLKNTIAFSIQNKTIYQALIIIISSVILLYWWIFLANPVLNEIINSKLKIFELEQLKEECENIIEQCQILKRDIKELSCRFDQICDPAKHQICEQVTLVFECAYKNNILLKSCKPTNTEDKGWYKKISFEMLFEGYFHQIAYFTKCLLSSKFLIECQSFVMKKRDNKIECVGNFNFIQIT